MVSVQCCGHLHHSNMAKITFVTGSLLLFLTLSAAAPAEQAPGPVREALVAPAPAEAKEDLIAAEKEDLKPAASHYGGWGYGGLGYGGYGHFGHYPYYSSYWGYPGWGYGGYGYGYGWPYYGGFSHGYWW